MRIQPPAVGPATPVRFPAMFRETLNSDLRVCVLPWSSVPIVTVALLMRVGAAGDPPARPGLASLTADMLDEGAGGRNSVQITEAFERLGSHLDIDVGQDVTVLTFTTLSRHLDAGLALASDVLMRPHFAEADLLRIRRLRLNRLRQLRTSASAAADRLFLSGVFGAHPYGHGSLGTSQSIEALTLDDVREFYGRMYEPAQATLIAAGDISPDAVVEAARLRFAGWTNPVAPAAPPEVPAAASPRVLLVDRPGAPQSELRIGHLGPERSTPDYHALVTLNAGLGGQFTSRINHHLRETKGYTYGARTGFDFRRVCSTFSCDTSVQSDATAAAMVDILSEFEAVRSTRPLDDDEVERARNSLTRGYVRHFETPADLVRAAAELSRFSLADDTFDLFVPSVSSVGGTEVREVAQRWIKPDDCVAVVVGDAAACRSQIEQLGREVVDSTPEF